MKKQLRVKWEIKPIHSMWYRVIINDAQNNFFISKENINTQCKKMGKG